MKPNAQYPVVVVGAGLVGASLALALSQRLPHLSILLIDQQGPQAPLPAGQMDPRVVALNLASQTLLEQLGVWGGLERLCAYTQMQVWDGEGSGAIDFAASELGQEQLGWIVENGHVLAQLHRLLAAAPQVHWLSDSLQDLKRQGDLCVLHTAAGETIQTPMILAADGARSRVRELAAIPVRQWSYGHTAIVCRVHTERPHRQTAYQRFTHQGPLAFLPLFPDGQQDSSIVWSLDNALAQQMMALREDEFNSALAAALEHRLGHVLQSDERLALPLHQCHARHYCAPGVSLLGDAAHAIHPLAGQGVNLGLADVAALVNELVRAQQRGLPLSHASVQDRYQRARMPHNLAAMAAMESFKRLFGNSNPYVGLVRNLGLRLAGQVPGVKQHFMRLASGR